MQFSDQTFCNQSQYALRLVGALNDVTVVKNMGKKITGTARNDDANNIFTKGEKEQANKNIIARKRNNQPIPLPQMK